jgi:hypothetical protein
MSRCDAMRLSALAIAMSLAALTTASAETATPNSQNGRYSFNPVADGVLRLDTRTGPSVGVQSERCRLGLQVSSR